MLVLLYEICQSPQLDYVIFMIQRRSGTLRLEVFSRVQSDFRFIFVNFELIREGQKHKKMTCSYKDNYFSETYF